MSTSLEGFIGKIMVVLVIYEQHLEDSPAFNSLHAALKPFDKTSSVFIYDNSAESQLFREKNWDSITYVHDSSNGGVSKAYNNAFEKASAIGKEWLLFTDQDTIFPEHFFIQCLEAINKNTHTKIFIPIVKDERGIVSPFRFTLGKGMRAHNVKPGTTSLLRWNFINSGLLISTKLFKKSGGYDERFQLDFTDLSFHKRLTHHVYQMHIVDVCCKHSLSSNQKKSANDALKRFYLYGHSSRVFSRVYHNYFTLVVMFLRSIKLSFKYLTIQFVKAGLNFLFIKKQSKHLL